MDGALGNHHHPALDILIDTARADTLTADELDAWLSAIGTHAPGAGHPPRRHEDMEPPAPATRPAPEYALYDLFGPAPGRHHRGAGVAAARRGAARKGPLSGSANLR